ncbi:MAG: hypothetical protein OEZ02_14675, partial [Anaerolineae bacterium]|nr:hypothetical protein [Anaerolineae bacterium]
KVDDKTWSISIKTVTGYADIIDFGADSIFEIKPISARDWGIVTVDWYSFAWREAYVAGLVAAPPYLHPGTNYPITGVIVGTDPNDPTRWIKAELSDPGVILYYAKNKNSKSPDPIPWNLFEWDPDSQTVKKRRSSDVLNGSMTPQPQLAFSSEVASGVMYLGICGIVGWLLLEVAEAAICGPCVLGLP